MAKRFTSTDKYKDPFIRGLKGAYKLLWDYINHECDHAGIWIVDFDIAQIYIGADMMVEKSEALKLFGKNVVELNNGQKWFIPSFVEFQYGQLDISNRVHNSIILLLQKNDVQKGLISSLQGAKDKDKDKVKESVKDKDTEMAEKIYSLYPSKCLVSNRSTGKCSKDKDKINTLLKIHSESDLTKIVENYITDCKKTNTYLKNFGTFLNNLPLDLKENVQKEEPKEEIPEWVRIHQGGYLEREV